MSERFDIAVSFAGEQRDYVREVVRAAKDRGLAVFYDKDMNNEWWGDSYVRGQRNVYSSQTRYFVPFLSNDYLGKSVTMDEFNSAMMTAMNKGDAYILPVLMENTTVPTDLLHPHIHYLRAEDYTPDQLADELLKKVESAKNAGQEPADLGKTVQRALGVRLPKVVPHDWSMYRELEAAFEHVAKRFQEGARALDERHLPCTVKVRDDKITARVERGGVPIAGIDIRLGGTMGDDKITWLLGTRNFSENSSNGWAIAGFDKERGVGYIDVSDLSASFHGRTNSNIDAEGLFEYLWALLIDQVEH